MRTVLGGLMVILAASACGDTATTAVDTTGDASTEEQVALEAEALSRIDAYYTAINDGRVDDLEAIIGTPLTEADQKSWEFHRIQVEAGTRWVLGPCEITGSINGIVNLECEMEHANPVFVATGASNVIAPHMFINDTLRSPTWRPAEGSTHLNFALSAYVDFFEEFYPDEYAESCDPDNQTGPFTEHGGLARVPACAELMVAHNDEVVEWIEAGQPTG